MTPGRQFDGDPPRLRDCGRQRIHFRNRQHRALRGSLLRGTLHDARISNDEFIGHGAGQHGVQEPVGLRRSNRMLPCESGVPGANRTGRDSPEWNFAEFWNQVTAEEGTVELNGAGLEIGPLAQPPGRETLKRQGGQPRIDPVATVEPLRLLPQASDRWPCLGVLR
jgi:hypothetical protein